MEESRKGWRRGSKGRRSAASAGGKGWQSRKQPAAKTGASRHRTRLVTLGLVAVSLLAVFIILVLIIPKDMPLVFVGVTAYDDNAIPPNAYVGEDAKRLKDTNTGNIKRMFATSERITRQTLEKHLESSLRRRGFGSFVNQDLVTIYLSAHGVVDSKGNACLLLSDSNALDETTWFPVSDLFKLLNAERPEAVKVVLLDSGKVEADWSLGVLYNPFPERVAKELENFSKIFVITDRASGQLAWSAPERGGTIFGHFVANGLSRAADKRGPGGVSILEFYEFVSANVQTWVRNNRSSDQTPLLMPSISEEQDVKLVSSGAGPSEEGSAKERIKKLSDVWRTKVLPLWERYDEFARDNELQRYDPLGQAALEARLLRAEQLLLAGSAYETELAKTISLIESSMSDVAKPALPNKLRGFSLPLAAQLEDDFDPETSGQKALDAWKEAGGWPKDEEGKKQPFALPYLEAVNVAWRWLLQSASEPGGPQLDEALQLVMASGRHVDDDGVPIEHVQEIQLLTLALQHADVSDAASWPSDLRVALRELMQTRQLAEQIAAPADERVHYWVQPLINIVDQDQRRAFDDFLIGDSASLASARDELVRCQAEGAAKAKLRLDEVSAAYALRDRIWARLPHIAFWFSQQDRLDQVQPGVASALQDAARLSKLLNTDDTTLEFTDEHREVVENLLAASNALEREFGDHVADVIKTPAASGTLFKAHQILRSPLAKVRDRRHLFLEKYLASMALDKDSPTVSRKPVSTEPPELPSWPTHPAVLFARHDATAVASDSDSEQEDAVTRFNVQGRLVRDALLEIAQREQTLRTDTEKSLRDANVAVRDTRSGVAKADELIRSAAALLGQRSDLIADPAQFLRKVDRHFQLLWHAHRALEDFWGPTDSLRSQPYFANVADVYLGGAKLLAPSSGYANALELTRLRERRVAATGVGVSTQPELKCYDAEEQRAHEFTVNWKPDVPTGRAAVFITEHGGSDPLLFPVLDGDSPVRRRGREIANATSKVDQRLQLAKPTDSTQLPLEAQVLFRGHQQSKQFMARWPKHTMPVRAEYSHPTKAKVTVQGDANRIGYIMFVVDCSLSMNERGRMDKALNSLGRVLDELGGQPNYAIGLRAYGRKSGFIPPAAGMSDYQKDDNGNYLVRLLDDNGQYKIVSEDNRLQIHPDEDANDRVVDLLLHENQAAKIRDEFKNLRPNGVTPLYLALTNSLGKDFPGDVRSGDDGSTKHIVLITDGQDFFSKREALGQTPGRTTAGDVTAAWQRSGGDTQIHIIFMDPPSDVAAELKEIPEETGGIYRGANQLNDIVQGIREAIGLVEFSVDTPGTSDSDPPKHRLGDTAEVTELRQDREVRIHGASDSKQPQRSIHLEGGEAIELTYLRPLNRVPQLMFPIKDPRSEAYTDAPIVPGFTPSGERHDFVFRAFRPEVKGADVDFSMMVQDIHDTKVGDRFTKYFTAPVRQVWCEITPVIGRSPLPDQTYYFYDVDNKLDQPVPTLQFRAKDWPSAARKARMKVWLSFDQIRLTGVEPIKIENSGSSKTFSVPGLEGVKFEALGEKEGPDEYRLTIYETETTLGSAAIRVSPAPDAITHTYYSFGGGTKHVVKHEYEFSERLTASIEVLPADKLKKDRRIISVQLPDVDVKE